ncbi:MAG: pseudouridine synthase [Betaproteobacteria bacterium]|nr:pseudouridine synthase [Betaproteobacteria bacterium]
MQKRNTLALPKKRAPEAPAPEGGQARAPVPKPAGRGKPAVKPAARPSAKPAARPAVKSAPRKPATAPVIATDTTGVRLSKRMSELGLASRREADEWIAKGLVRVDGQVVSELGSRILPDQLITIDSAAKDEQRGRVTILMHKPMGYVSGQAEDGHQPASVLFKAENRWNQDGSPVKFHPLQAKGLAPAGRLDIDSTGLIVFTQDGRIAKQLIGENSAIEKEYLVRVEGQIADGGLQKLCHGLSLDGVALKPAKVSWQNEDQLRFALREGKKRQIRRMCEMVGLKVTGLKRIRIGKVTLGALPVGKWRYLGPHESFD